MFAEFSIDFSCASDVFCWLLKLQFYQTQQIRTCSMPTMGGHAKIGGLAGFDLLCFHHIGVWGILGRYMWCLLWLQVSLLCLWCLAKFVVT